MFRVISLALEVLILDAEVQPREEMSRALIREYAALYSEGHTLAPIVVFREGQEFWLADGFHRVSAAREAGLAEIDAEVHEGSRRDATLYACGSNTHGKPRTNEDKRRVVTRLLQDREWSEWSDREIARHCGVSNRFVSLVRKELFPSVNGIQIPRTVQRNGTIYAMDTSAIGQHRTPLEGPIPRDQSADAMTRPEIEAAFPARGTGPVLYLIPDPPPVQDGKRPTFNQTNEMVDWAKWTWNPVTGCLHNCVYCYARDIAERFYPEKFRPTFHPERLRAPQYTKVPSQAETEIGWRNVFVCSMADLFGKWVPQEWIDAVLTEVRAAPQWNFLFLTKFPQRLAEIDWPSNAYVGTSVDEQYRVAIAERAFREVNAPIKWLSVEPFRERLTFRNLELFDWVVIGGQSKSSQAPAFQPPWEWVEHLQQQVRAAGCSLYWKPNLLTRPQELPESMSTLQPTNSRA
jgi:protein gp37